MPGGGSIFGGGDMGDFGANGAEVRGSSCGFPVTGKKYKGNLLEVRVVAEGDGKTVLQGEGTHPLWTHVDRRQAPVTEWVALRPILGVFPRDIGYEGEGRLRVPWWRKAASYKQLKVTV